MTVGAWRGAYAHIFAAEKLARLADEVERSAAFWRRVIATGDRHVVVAERCERVVGFANFGRTLDDDVDEHRVGQLIAINVVPEAWGAGAGRALMNEVLAGLRRDAFEEAILWVVEDNPRARTFYEHSGWRTDGAAKNDTLLGTTVREVRYRRALRD